MTIKICGIRNETDLDVAVKAGTNAVGFLVGLTHFSEDQLTPAQAQILIKKVPPFIVPVLVTHLPTGKEIVELHNELGTTVIQLHGEMKMKEVAVVRSLLPHGRLLKALHIADNASMPTLLDELDELRDLVNAVLLDSRTDDRLGGTGQTHDWRLSRQIRQASGLPVILAGGLTADNVATAIEVVRPAGVDVNSGVEDAWGNKSFDKCSRFVESARSAQVELASSQNVIEN